MNRMRKSQFSPIVGHNLYVRDAWHVVPEVAP